MTAFDTRPPITESDCWSYQDGSLVVHEVLSGDETTGFRLNGAPAHGGPADDALNDADPLCKGCAYAVAARHGYEPPLTAPTAYQPGHRPRPSEVLLHRDPTGRVDYVASYSYGRAYFDAGEPRTTPCRTCGVETLIDTFAPDPEGTP